MKCPHCSYENSPDAPFCQNCGEVFPARIDLPEIKTPSTDPKRRGEVLSDVPPIVKVPDIPRPEVKRTAPEDREAPLPDLVDVPDLSGFERLVDSSYVPPAPHNSAGDTAELPVIEEEYVPRARSYTLGLDPKEQRKRDREQRKLEKKFVKQQQKEEARAAKEAERAERAAAKAAEEEERRAQREAEAAERAARKEAEAAERAERKEAEALERAAREAAAEEERARHAAEEASAERPAPAGDAAADGPDDSAAPGLVVAARHASQELAPRRATELAAPDAGADDATAEGTLALAGAEGDEPEATSTGLAPRGTGAIEPAADTRIEQSPNPTPATEAAAGPSAAGTPEAASSARAATSRKAEKPASSNATSVAKKRGGHGTRSKKLIIIGIAAAVAVALAGAAVGTYFAELWGGKSVPEVVGMGQQEATNALQEKGFAVETAEAKSDEPAGTILGTEPGAGARVEEGSTVVLTVATPRIIPEVKGLTQQEAADALAAEGFTAIEYKEKKSNKAEGTVLSIKPGAGEEAKADTSLAVTVAVPFTVPDIEGKSEADAKKALEDEGYEVKTDWYVTEDIEEGIAVSTDPKAGTKLDSGSEVTLYIAHSRGTELRDLTASILPGATLTKDNVTYQVQTVKSTSYRGEGEVSYTVTAKKYEVVSLPFGLGEKTYYDDKLETIEGGIVWNDSNEVSYANPAIRY